MRFGKSYKEMETERHERKMAALEKAKRGIVKYAYFPTQIEDGTWIWLERYLRVFEIPNFFQKSNEYYYYTQTSQCRKNRPIPTEGK